MQLQLQECKTTEIIDSNSGRCFSVVDGSVCSMILHTGIINLLSIYLLKCSYNTNTAKICVMCLEIPFTFLYHV